MWFILFSPLLSEDFFLLIMYIASYIQNTSRNTSRIKWSLNYLISIEIDKGWQLFLFFYVKSNENMNSGCWIVSCIQTDRLSKVNRHCTGQGIPTNWIIYAWIMGDIQLKLHCQEMDSEDCNRLRTFVFSAVNCKVCVDQRWRCMTCNYE
jgi:hypothetical protein